RPERQAEHRRALEELLTVELACHELVDDVVLECSCLRAAVLVDCPQSLSVHAYPPLQPAPMLDAIRRGPPLVPAPTAAVLLVDSDSTPMGGLSHVPASLVKPMFCMWIAVPNRCTLRSDGGGQVRRGNGCAAGRRPPAAHLGGCQGDARRARSSGRPEPALAVRDLTRARDRKEHAPP